MIAYMHVSIIQSQHKIYMNKSISFIIIIVTVCEQFKILGLHRNFLSRYRKAASKNTYNNQARTLWQVNIYQT